MNDKENKYNLVDELPLWSAIPGIRILETVCYRKNICALDIGFGLGFPLIELAMRLGNTSKVYGIDPWKAGIIYTKQKLRLANVKNVKLVEGQAEKMPFKNDNFDLIVSNNGINNVQNLNSTLHECNRVSKIGAQFVFTFNTNKTFSEFYDIYRSALKDNKLMEYEEKVNLHIYSKRKPLSEIKNTLQTAGFGIETITHDMFRYHFSNASAMMNHSAIKLLFMKSWKHIIPANSRKRVFKSIEEIIDSITKKEGKFSMSVPFITINCKKLKNIRNN